jgi:hypothetical protein
MIDTTSYQAPSPSNGPADDAAGPAPAGEIQIDPEFAGLVPPHSPEEREQLEANLLAAGGCRDPLVVWKGHGVLLEGHQRLALCRKHNFPIPTTEVELPDRGAALDWIIDNQLGRRNLTPEQVSYLRGRRYNAEKQAHGGDRKRQRSSAHSEHLKTAEAVAERYGVSPATVRRDGSFAEDVDTIAADCGEGAKQAILGGTSGVTREEVGELARMEPEARQEAANEALSGGKKPRARDTRQKPAVTQITVPVDPKELARAVLERLGRERAAEVRDELGRLLLEAPEPARHEEQTPPQRRRRRKREDDHSDFVGPWS